ncbi:hypothetical protein V2J09_009468 [Rumex salicifolius]
MAMASTSSFTLSSFAVPKPKSLPHILHSLSSSLKSSAPATASAFSVAFPSLKHFPALSSKFVRNVAMSSDVEQEEDEEVYGERNFSADVKLFVGNLPFSADSAQLAGLFESAGNVEMVEVIYDKMTGRSRGFGFVTMSSVEEAEAAAQQFNGYDLDGRTLRVNAGPPPPRREGSFPPPRREGSYSARGESSFSRSPPRGGSSFDSNHRIHVGNLSWGVDDLALRSMFSDHGNVVEAKVIYDRESGRSRGFGFVTYNSSEEVNSAIDSLDGADLDGRQIRVTQAEARPPRRQF